MKVIGYRRVSTREQGISGLGMDAQQEAIERWANGRAVQWIEDRGRSGASLRRAGIQQALRELEAGDVLVVSKLDRLARSLGDFVALVERSRRGGWMLVCLDLGVDTTTPAGELAAHVIAAAAHYERRLIGARTADALAQAKARGVHVGRPRAVSDAVRDRVTREWLAGTPLRRIGEGLVADGILPPRGGDRWAPSTLRSLVGTAGS